MKELTLALFWHQHQPYYPDDVGGENPMPWVRLHGVKDYYGMALHLLEVPEMRCTINLVPSLLLQLQGYTERGATDRPLEVSRRPADGLSEEGVVVVRAINNEGIESAALSGKADVAAAHVEGDAWSEQREIDEVAAVCGEVLNGDIIHGGAHLTTRGFDNGRFIRDGDGLGLPSHREGEVHVQPGADTECDVLLRQLGETWVLDFDGVSAYWKDGKGKEAVGITSGLKVDGRPIVGSRQLGAGKSGAGLIDDDAFDGALISLRPRRRQDQEKEKKECEASAQESCTRFRNVHSSSPSEGGRDFLRSGPQRRCSGANRDAAKSKKTITLRKSRTLTPTIRFALA